MLNRYQRTIPTTTSTCGNPTRLDWIIAVYLVIVQQSGAFVDIANEFFLLSAGDANRGTENVFNTVSIVMSIILLCIGIYPCSASYN